jgi:autotransporter-associated beta strand protein
VTVVSSNFTGTLDLQEGLVRFSTANLLPNAIISNISDTQGTLSLSNSVDQTFNGPVFLGGAGTLLFAGTGNATFTNSVTLSSLKRISQSSTRTLAFLGPIGGTGGIQKLGSGFLFLAGTNSYSGDTIVGNGTVTINDFSQLGSAATPISLGGTTVGAALVINSANQATTRGITVNPFGGTLSYAGNLTVGAITGANVASGTLTKVGAGILTTGPIQVGTLNATTGAVVTTPNGTEAGTNRLGTLILGGSAGSWTSQLDLNNNNLVIDYSGASPLATVADQIKSGWASGSWTGQGITSGSAAAVAAGASLHKTALGFAEASTLAISTFSGQNLDTDAVVVRYTYYGDANVDGVVNALDFNALASSYGSTGSWVNGDSNYDGQINSLDFDAVSLNFNRNIAAAPALGSVVPEPIVATAVMMLGTCVLMRRRRVNEHA